ncbi:energy transducer TonB [Rhodocyclus tenuis]|uniref:Protein TonB n=1 Tax=Rhodocyclus tenuis TaxID=1066 RepID=A0A840G8G5_RHOTE|nr:energy transducer TonB [Rhodocyclus tenuis]MBB4246998.1 protein TonB [Rhodocyclus tenuis]
MPRISGRGVIGIALAHAALLGLLATLDVTPIRASMATLTVDLIPAAVQPVAAEKPPTPATAKPAPVTPRQPPRVQAPMLAAQTEAPTATVDSSKPSEPAAPAAAPSSAKAAAVSPPRFDADYLHNPAPVYPALSRRMGEEGRVMLRVFVDATGRPAQIELNSSSGSARLDAAAQEAVWRWSFVAARRGDDSVGAWVLVPIVFNLRG